MYLQKEDKALMGGVEKAIYLIFSVFCFHVDLFGCIFIEIAIAPIVKSLESTSVSGTVVKAFVIHAMV